MKPPLTNIQEAWTPVSGYEGYYEVSNLGRFKIKERIVSKNKRGQRTIKERITKGNVVGLDGNDYMTVTLSKNGTEKSVKLHRLVACHFIPNPQKKKQVNHKDGDRFNNKSENLEWCTARENVCHAYINSGKKFKSKYPGVTLFVPTGKWQARIQVNGKRISLGHFKKEEDAYNARMEYIKKNNIPNKYSIIN